MPEEKIPAAPSLVEVSPSAVKSLLEPYIGEVSKDPRRRASYYTGSFEESEAVRLYRDILRDERCDAALDQRLDAVISRPWEVEPGGPARRDRLAAESLREQLSAIRFNEACRQLLFAVWYGYAVAEAIWERDGLSASQAGGRVILADLRVRAQERFRWGDSQELLLRTRSNPNGEKIPPGKFVVVKRAGDHGDVPHGPGKARWCYWPVWLKRHGLKFWCVALEKFGAPTPKGTYRRGAGQEEIDKLLELMRAVSTGTGIAVPEGQDIELMESARRAGGDYDAFVAYLDKILVTTILGQASTTDQGPWRGTAEIQKDVRDEVMIADARLLDAALNTTVSRWLTGWNFPGAAIPQIRRNAEPREDLDARAAREETVARTTGLRPTRRHVEQVYGGEWEPGEVAAGEPTAPPLTPALSQGEREKRAALQEAEDRDAMDERLDNPPIDPGAVIA